MSISVDVSEVVKLAGMLGDATTKVAAGAPVAVGRTAEQVAADWKAGVGVHSGELRDSIHVVGSGLEREVTSSSRYAAYHEFGTSDTAPNPAAIPAGERGEKMLGVEVEKLGTPW